MVKKLLLPIFVFFSLTFIIIYFTPYIRQLYLSLGLVKEEVYIAGTGSMYPTFPKSQETDEVVAAGKIVAWPKMRRYPAGVEIFGFDFFPYQIKRGDIVEFENEKTKAIAQEKYGQEAGFVKRVIAFAEDTIELRDGYVLVNGNILTEPYTAKPRSTYGGDFLADCHPLKIPEGYVFVLGDNRKASLDSRFELAAVSLADIHYVLPWEHQEEYKKLWRDTREDLSLAHTSTLDSAQFVRLLNEKRKGKNLRPYKYDLLLSNSAKLRGQAMIKFNDFSTEATKSGIGLTGAIKEAGYKNITFAEVYTRGFYEADELLDNFLEFPETKKILYSAEYQDMGLSAVLGEIDNCPVQVVMAHLGGYVPPNYSEETVESWQKLVDNLQSTLPSWEALKTADNINQESLNRFLSVSGTRLSNAQRILTRMKANQWPTEEEKRFVEDDKNLAMEMEKLIGELKK